MKTVLEHLRPHYKSLALVMLMHTIATLTELLMPYVMSDVVDRGIAASNIRRVVISSGIMLVLAVLSLTAALISNKINTRVTTSFSSSLCKATFKKINSLSPEQYSKIGSSGLLTRSTDDIFNVLFELICAKSIRRESNCIFSVLIAYSYINDTVSCFYRT